MEILHIRVYNTRNELTCMESLAYGSKEIAIAEALKAHDPFQRLRLRRSLGRMEHYRHQYKRVIHT